MQPHEAYVVGSICVLNQGRRGNILTSIKQIFRYGHVKELGIRFMGFHGEIFYQIFHENTESELLFYTTNVFIRINERYAQLVERQTSIHEVVGSSPTRRSTFSYLNLHNSPCVRAYGVFPPSLSPQKNKKKTHTQPVPR